MFFSFGFTTLGFKRKHEFGIENFPKFIQIDFLFITLIILGKSQNKSLTSLMGKYAYSETELDWHPQVRLARRRAIAKGRAEGQAEFKEQNNWLMKKANEALEKYQASEQENRELRQTIKGMKLVGYEEETKHIDDGETPAVILEAAK